MVNYSPQVRSSSGNYYPTKPADGPGARAYAASAPQPSSYYGQQLTPALKNEYWSNGQDKNYAYADAYSQGGTRGLLQASPSFAPALQNAEASYTPGLGRAAATQYNQQYGGPARFYGGALEGGAKQKSKSKRSSHRSRSRSKKSLKSRKRPCKDGKTRRGTGRCHKIRKIIPINRDSGRRETAEQRSRRLEKEFLGCQRR